MAARLLRDGIAAITPPGSLIAGIVEYAFEALGFGIRNKTGFPSIQTNLISIRRQVKLIGQRLQFLFCPGQYFVRDGKLFTPGQFDAFFS